MLVLHADYYAEILRDGQLITIEYSEDVAVESVVVGGKHFKAKLLAISDMEMKTSSPLGGLIDLQLGSFTLIMEGDLPYINQLAVVLYRYNPYHETLVELGIYNGILQASDRDSITFGLWALDQDELIPAGSKQYYNTTMYGAAGRPLNDVLGYLNISTVNLHEDTVNACPAATKGIYGSEVWAGFKVGTLAKQALSELLASRCCIGVLSGSVPAGTRTLDIFNQVTGFGNVVHVKKKRAVRWEKTKSDYSFMELKADFYCSESLVTDRIFAVNTRHRVGDIGSAVSVQSFAPYSETRLNYVDTYASFLSLPRMELEVTAEYDVNIGDLIILEDDGTVETVIVTGLKFGSSLDSYTVYGVMSAFAEVEVSPGVFEWWPSACTNWDTSTDAMPSAWVSGPPSPTTITGTNQLTISWTSVDGPILYCLLYVYTNGVGSFVCGTEVRTDGTDMSCTFPYKFAPGTYTYDVEIAGTNLKTDIRTVTFA